MSEREPQEGSADLTGSSSQRGTGHRPATASAQDLQFATFYSRVMPGLTGFLIYQGASPPLAADLAQEAMIKAYQRWPTIKHPRAWVYVVAGRDLVRHLSRVRENPVEDMPEPSAQASLLRGATEVSYWEQRHDLLRALARLPARQRQVMAWTLAGFTPAEIAHELKLTGEAVRSTLYKARRACAEHLRDWEGDQR